MCLTILYYTILDLMLSTSNTKAITQTTQKAEKFFRQENFIQVSFQHFKFRTLHHIVSMEL